MGIATFTSTVRSYGSNQGTRKVPRMSTRKSAALLLAVLVAGAALITTPASAATKSITCYKGSSSKVVKTATPKCPAGWSTTKPVVKPTTKPTTPASTAKTLTINATYTGKITVLWSDSDVQATSVTATGTGTTLGLTQLVLSLIHI